LTPGIPEPSSPTKLEKNHIKSQQGMSALFNIIYVYDFLKYFHPANITRFHLQLYTACSFGKGLPPESAKPGADIIPCDLVRSNTLIDVFQDVFIWTWK
jgi:hypothetical protein